MAVKSILFVSALVGLCLTSCTNTANTDSEITTKDTLTNLKPIPMKSYISMFEIPATDISRAINFYEIVLDVAIEKMEMPEMQMGILPYEDQLISCVIVQAEGYAPSADGVTIYLNGGDDLQVMLDKVEPNGGKILIPKTMHADESGYFAIFLDSEGNKIGLHSPN